MKDNHCVIGIDIGGTNIRIGHTQSQDSLTHFEQTRTNELFQNGKDPAKALAAHIRTYMERNLTDTEVSAVSIGFPSTINRARTVLYQTPNIDSIPDNYPVVELLSEELQLPVYINRDVNMLLLQDLKDLGVEDADSVCAVYFGTGVGNAVMLNGRILIGHNGTASEMGHMPVIGNTRRCVCGNESCLETILCGIALEDIRKTHFPDTEIGEIFAKKKDTPELQEFVRGMAQIIAIEENLFDPECVILGGGLLYCEGFPKETLESLAHAYTRKPYPEKTMEIRYSKPTQENGVKGACIYAKKRMEDAQYL
ncbi:MAG: allose kinase [Lachnospiraceae bacterium]|nr:allose kinase [Lachnospiraceae bacterium]